MLVFGTSARRGLFQPYFHPSVSFQGRSTAVPVDPEEPGYFLTVADYIHSSHSMPALKTKTSAADALVGIWTVVLTAFVVATLPKKSLP